MAPIQSFYYDFINGPLKKIFFREGILNGFLGVPDPKYEIKKFSGGGGGSPPPKKKKIFL